MIEVEKDAVAGAANLEPRNVWRSIGRGLRGRCPACGEGKLFKAYLKVQDACPSCAEELHHQRADDAPPYVTIFIVGHIVIPGLLLLERLAAPATWVHLAIWLPLTVILSLWILPRVKGAFVGLQWALRMHGFDPDGEQDVYDPSRPPNLEAP